MSTVSRTSLDVLVVDDSAVVRQALAVILARDAEIVVTVAADPVVALTKIRRMNPDVIVLDLDMPRMDGLTFLAQLMAENPVPVVICSGLAAPHTEAAMRALELGAVAIIAKPEYGVQDFLHRQAEELIRTIRNAAEVRVRRRSGAYAAGPVHPKTAPILEPYLPAITPSASSAPIVAIGASTGGVQAVTEVLAALPPGCPPLLVAQHMPSAFTGAFARRLQDACRIEVKEAETGDQIIPGRALIAPGDRHLTLHSTPSGLQARLSDGPRVSGHRPSVDVLFRSVGEVMGRQAIGILLTGMGEDGAAGLLTLRQAGAVTIAQDESSSVVWGMPKAGIDRGGASMVLPLGRIVGTLLARAGGQITYESSNL
jgi:two-component system, chemotaxis family, protein-glutamate methylesterase/glutaminase